VRWDLCSEVVGFRSAGFLMVRHSPSPWVPPLGEYRCQRSGLASGGFRAGDRWVGAHGRCVAPEFGQRGVGRSPACSEGCRGRGLVAREFCRGDG